MKRSTSILFFFIALWNISIGQDQIGEDIDGRQAMDFSGRAVELSADGNRVAIGSTLQLTMDSKLGHVRIFEWIEDSWVQIGQDIGGDLEGNQASRSISMALNGQRIAIGARLNSDAGNEAGKVSVYDWDGVEWIQLGNDLNGQMVGARFGASVSLSEDGKRLSIGSPRENELTGSTRVYEWNGNEWNQLGTTIVGKAFSSQLGMSVSLSSDGQHLAVGASGTLIGYVQIFEWVDNEWQQLGEDVLGDVEGDLFGHDIELSASGHQIIIGIPFYNQSTEQAGLARVYHWNGMSWEQTGGDIESRIGEFSFGICVSITSDGNRIALGAPLNKANLPNAGLIRLYDWDGESWAQVGTDLYGEATADQSGTDVSLTSNGSRVAIGAWLNDGNGMNSGHTRVYEMPVSTNTSLNLPSERIIYPNPTTGIIHCAGLNDEMVRVLDIHGHLCKIVTQPELGIDITNLSPGIYFLSFENNKGEAFLKVVKI